MAPVLAYNEKKVLSGVASVIGYANLPDCDFQTVQDTFARLERGANYPVREVSFHASINPSEDDACSEQDVLRLVTEMMVRSGYGRQPFIVYRHNDIDREHYHVVSIRIDEKGKKINSYYEGEKMNRFLASVQNKYGFTLGRADGRKSAERKQPSGPRLKMSSYNPRKEEMSQLKAICEGALHYDFAGFAQFACILRDFGVAARLRACDTGEYMTLQPVDRSGKQLGPVVSEQVLGYPLHADMKLASSLNSRSHGRRHREKERVENLVSAAFQYAKSEPHFEALLHNKGIDVHLSRTQDGDIFGLTFVDHTTRTVFKGSELRHVISVQMMKEAVETCRWRTEDRGQTVRRTYLALTKERARREEIAMRDRQIALMAQVLRTDTSDYAVYDGHGENWEYEETPTTDGPVMDDIMGGMRIRLD